MPEDALDSGGSPSGELVDFLLLSTLNLLTAHRVRAQLTAAGIASAETALGLKISCRDLDWMTLLESIGVMISEVERRGTRVALVPVSEDPTAIQRAIFHSQSLDLLLVNVRDRWFESCLRRKGVTVFVQPLVQFPPGRLHGYECLMRGLDDDGRLIPPNRMFEAARRLEKLHELDELCRLSAVRAAAQFGRGELTFFINFIPGVTRDPRRALIRLMEEVDAAELSPQQICFEVVETEKISRRRDLLNAIQYYRKAGFKVALDDVGAGYSTLLALSVLRPDYIKIDGELVRRAATSALEAKMVRDLAETARQNGIITIAEGIETIHEFQLALECGVRVTQGYFHARPHPPENPPEPVAQMLTRVATSAQVRKAS